MRTGWAIATPVRLAATVASHGWAKLAPWQWDGEAGLLTREETVAGNTGRLCVRQAGAELEAFWEGNCGDERLMRRLESRVRRWLFLDWDPEPFIAAAAILDPALSRVVAEGGGRLLRASTFHEDFVKTLLTVNTNWASTCRMAAALVGEVGAGVFPGPEAILAYGAERLAQICRLGYRAPHLMEALGRMRADKVLDEEGEADEAALSYEYLIGLRGIGPYAAAHCRMLLGDFSRLPIDTEMTAHLASLGLTAKTAGGHLAPWGPWGLLALRLRRQLVRAEEPVSNP